MTRQSTAEENALHAVLAGWDDDTSGDVLDEILSDFRPGELRALERACEFLAHECAQRLRDMPREM